MGLITKTIKFGVLAGGIYALPSAPVVDSLAAVQPSAQYSTFAMISAAAETVADVKGFCERRPQACVTGQYLALTLESKARYAVKLASEWANPAKGETLKTEAPPLRLATLNDPKPQSINDLLRKTTAE
jgi:Family of unknown function (DUF5330)